ncbi:MAG: energy transducer TonB [Candidatus Margulisiibacteriota bacterium]
MKTKNVSLVAVGVILIAAVMVSFLMSRTSSFVQKSEMPLFMGQEMVVQNKAVGVVEAVKVAKAVRINRAVKAVSNPMPQPKVAAPLPIFPPKVSFSVLPQYPVTALEQGLQGTTILSIYVGMSGAAEDVQIKASSGVSELDQSAVAAATQWKFNPAAQGGSALASWFEVPVSFRIN